ncbi:zinc finger BED domain-containing protein DAYSLEEPER [Prunus persica]|uniref:zinc finger BED domain-containing protein DAYSLEEPER n=1 Tax=Prunus persica TaxID=3760 RepID=UPI0009AB4D5E|nr:zinc finger BED domain-containing protein DAYSLEEPER [Prunus persica]
MVLICEEELASNQDQMHGNDDYVPCSDVIVPPTAASQNPTSSPLEPSTGKRKPCKKESDVWEHFEKYDLVLDLKGVDGTKTKEVEKRAECKYCSATYASDTKKNGTNNMWKHLKKQCLQYPYRHKDKNTWTLAFDASKGNALVSRNFNKDDCLDACIRMVVRDELPFSFVEGEGFSEFCSVACPQFNPPSHRTLGRRFLEMYPKMKEKLKVDLRSHRICLTTDTWTSVQNVNYMVLTAHFVDSDYKMHKRILNFCVIDSHKWESIRKLLENCLIDWGHEKILTITANNAATNTKAIEYVRKKINGWKDSNSVLGGVQMCNNPNLN